MSFWGILAGIAIGVGVVATGGLLLPAVGFTSAGVAAGSLAAATQASIGSVVAGSAFATCQSIGATGVLLSGGALATGGAVGGGVGVIAAR